MTRPGGVLRQLGTLGSGTVLAALLGVGLQGLLAAWFGAGAESDAWFWSLSIYAFLAKFLMLTQLKSLSIPVFVKQREADPERARTFLGGLTAVSAAGLGVAVGIAIVVAPFLVDVLAPGLDDERTELTALLLRIRLPALAALGITTVGLIALEGTKRFGRSVSAQRVIPAAVSLAGLAALGSWLGIRGAAIAGLAGGLAGMLVVLGVVRREGRPVGLRTALANADLRGTLRSWLTFSSSNASVFVGEWVFRVGASLLPLGYFSAVMYGRMIHDLAHGALNDAATSVGLTRFSEAARDPERLGPEVRRAVAALAGVALPVALFLALSADRIVALLFGRGQFASDGLAFVAVDALRIYAVGLFLQGIVQLLFAGLFARGEGSRVNAVQLLGHLGRAAWLVPLVLWLGFRGLVLAQVLMNLVVALLLLTRIPRDWWSFRGLASNGARLAVPALGLTALSLGAARWLPTAGELSLVLDLGLLTGMGGAFALIWLGIALTVGAPGAHELVTLARRALGRGRRVAAIVGLLGAGLLAGPSPAGAQDEEACTTPGWSAAPIPADPAIRAELRRLEAAGEVPIGSSTIEPLSGLRLEHLLCSGGPAAREFAARLDERFRAAVVTGAISTGAQAFDGPEVQLDPRVAVELRLAPPSSPVHAWLSGPLPEEDDARFGAPNFGFSGGRLHPGGGLRGGLGVELGPLLLSAGRTGVQLGGGPSGAIALNRDATLDAVLLQTNWPLALPVLGEVEFLVGIAPKVSYGAVDDPWFAFTRTTLRPHRTLQLGLSRGILFGGSFQGGSVAYDPVVYGPDDRSADLGDVVRTLFGRLNDFDNQVASVDVRWALAGFGLPVALRAEIGFEDADRSWGDPGLQLGADWALSDGATLLRYEYLAFGAGARWCPSCDRLPAFWYNHTRFQDGFRSEEALFGHALGGYGRRHALGIDHRRAELALSLEGGWLRRERWNLLESARPGSALHLDVHAEVAARPGVVVRFAGGIEEGDDWRFWRGEAAVEWRFRR